MTQTPGKAPSARDSTGPGCSGGKKNLPPCHAAREPGQSLLPEQVHEANTSKALILGGFMHGRERHSARKTHGLSASFLLMGYGDITNPGPSQGICFA